MVPNMVRNVRSTVQYIYKHITVLLHTYLQDRKRIPFGRGDLASTAPRLATQWFPQVVIRHP